MRVQVLKRPRIASTRTSAGSRCEAASGWRAFQRSRPAKTSDFFLARPISTSGIFETRRPVAAFFFGVFAVALYFARYYLRRG